MAWAPVAGAAVSASGSVNTTVTTPAIDTTGVTFLVASVQSGAIEGNFFDSQSNTWTPLTLYSSGFFYTRLWYVINPSVNASHTFTHDAGGLLVFPGVSVAGFTGEAVAPFDQENGNQTATGNSSVQPGSITPSANNCLIISGCQTGSTTLPTVDSGFTLITQSAGVADTSFGSSLAYLIQTSASASNPTWSAGSADVIAATIASFKAAASAGTTWPGYQSPFGWT